MRIGIARRRLNKSRQKRKTERKTYQKSKQLSGRPGCASRFYALHCHFDILFLMFDFEMAG